MNDTNPAGEQPLSPHPSGFPQEESTRGRKRKAIDYAGLDQESTGAGRGRGGDEDDNDVPQEETIANCQSP